MRAGRRTLRGEGAPRVDRNLAPRHPHRVVRRNARALHLDRAAACWNLVARQIGLAVGGQQLGRPCCRSSIGRRDILRCRLAVQPQRPRIRFIEIALRVIGAKQVLEFACRARENLCRRLPLRETRVIDRNGDERRGLQ